MPSTQLFHPSAPTVMVVPWHDPLVDSSGHDVRSQYVELFWLHVLGPTATWALRRLVSGLDRYPLGYELDLVETANELGLSYSPHTSNTFVKALQRCAMFGVVQPLPDSLAVRRRLPTVSARHLARMPESLQSRHRQWATRSAIGEVDRGRALAAAMLAAGDDPDVVERQLLAMGLSPDAAVACTTGAVTS